MLDISEELDVYRLKWIKYFGLKGWKWDDDLLYDTIVKCEDTISRLGLREGKKESWNYLFKALTTNYIREQEYCRNKLRDQVDDIGVLYETYMNKQRTVEEKEVSDLWEAFQVEYILKWVDINFRKEYSYLFRMKYVLCLKESEIKKKTKIQGIRKELNQMIEIIRNHIKIEDIRAEFAIKYPEIDLDILSGDNFLE